MANYAAASTNVKVFYGDLTGSIDSSSLGSITKEAYDHILTLDTTNEPLISVTTTSLGYGNKVAITIVNAK
tara:strand:+ start:1057 stop:1269 length:213 start_codon:yes stop_codon:yes gene_type:complete